MNVELLFKINTTWQKIELSESLNYTINKQFIDLNDLTSISTDYTKTIKIPFTPRNNEIFNFYFKIQSRVMGSVEYYTFDPSEKIDCIITYNNNVLLSGYFVIDDISAKDKTYNGTIYSTVNQLYKDLLSQTIKDYEVMDGHNIMENIRVSPDIIKRSIDDTFVPNYSENSINNFEEIMGFAVQEIPNTDILDTTKIQYSKSAGVDPTLPPVDMDAYIKYLHDSYDTSFHKSLINKGISFPFKMEVPVLTTKAYLYVKSLISMIKHKLSSEYDVTLDTSDIDNDIPDEMCYFPSCPFNEKDFAKQDSNVLNIEKNNTVITSGMYSSFITAKTPKNVNIPLSILTDENSQIHVENYSSSIIKVSNLQSSVNTFDLIINQSLWYGGQNTRNISPTRFDVKPIDMYFKHRINYPVITVYYQSPSSPYATNNYVSAIHVYYAHNKIRHEWKNFVKRWINTVKQSSPNLEVFETNDDKGYNDDFQLSPNKITYQSTGLNPVCIHVRVNPYSNTFLQVKQFVFNNPTNGFGSYPTIFMNGGWYDKAILANIQHDVIPIDCLADINSSGTITKDEAKDVVFQFLTVKMDSVLFKFNGPSSYTRKYNNLSGFFGDFIPFKWLFDFCKKNRYYVEYNEDKKCIKIYSKYFTESNGLKIVEKYIDYSKDVNIKPLNNEYSKIKFGYKENKNQNLNEYVKTYGQEFGDLTINTLYSNSKETLKLSTGDEICPVITNKYSINWDTLKDWNPNNSIPVKVQKYNYYVIDDVVDNKYGNNNFYLFRSGVTVTNNYFITWPSNIEMANNIFSYHVSTKTDSSEVSNQTNLRMFKYHTTNGNGENVNIFFNKPMIIFTNEDLSGSEDLYTHRWQNYLDEIFDINNKKVTCYVPLSVAEYYNFRFNQLWNIEGNLFIVNKIIDFNPANNEPTKVELIQVNNIENYN